MYSHCIMQLLIHRALNARVEYRLEVNQIKL